MTRREWLVAAAAAPLAAQSPDLDRFFQEFLEQWVKAEPESATAMRLFTGEEQNRLDSRLNDISDQAVHARIARARDGLTRLGRFDASKFSPAQRQSAEQLWPAPGNDFPLMQKIKTYFDPNALLNPGRLYGRL